MVLDPFPASAAWRHVGARDGFEVVHFARAGEGVRLRGCTTAVEDGRGWSVRYDITVDPGWRSVRAHVRTMAPDGEREVLVEGDATGRWWVDGWARPDLDGCLDVDLESSACTNTMPVHRMRLGIGEAAEAPAVYVRATDLVVERLEQRYDRVDDDGPLRRFHYVAPAFDTDCTLVFDGSGLVLDYPGLASRVV